MVLSDVSFPTQVQKWIKDLCYMHIYSTHAHIYVHTYNIDIVVMAERQIILTNFTHRADTCLSYRALQALYINDAIAFYMYILITAWRFTSASISEFLVTPGMFFRITTLLFSITGAARAVRTILWGHSFCQLVRCSGFQVSRSFLRHCLFLLARHLGKHSYRIAFLRVPLPEVVMLSSKTEV